MNASGETIAREAHLSPCGAYRYTLTRDLRSGRNSCNFVMLNPSTADSRQDDPTIRRCVAFCHAWGFARLVVTNLFAYRATDPAALAGALDPIGPENDKVLRQEASRAQAVVCAWGTGGSHGGRGLVVRQALAAEGVPLLYLRLTRDGHPGHPLYLPGTLTPQPWL